MGSESKRYKHKEAIKAMKKIYKGSKLVEVQLNRSEQHYLMKENIKLLTRKTNNRTKLHVVKSDKVSQ